MSLGTFELFTIAMLLISPILWKSSHALQYYVKIVVYSAWVIFCTTLVLPVAIFRPKNADNIRFIQMIMNRTSWIFGISVEARNRQNLDSDKPRVFVCNHQSSVDVLTVMKVLPRHTTAMMKKQLMYAGTFGATSWLSGIIFVDRAGKGQGHKITEGVANIMHKRKVNVWVFPEGTRNFNDDILPFKKGAFFLAIQAQAPICPVVISSYKNFMDKKNKVFNSGGRVIIECLPQISTEGLTVDDVDALTERVRNMMRETYMKLSAEVLPSSSHNGAKVGRNGIHAELSGVPDDKSKDGNKTCDKNEAITEGSGDVINSNDTVIKRQVTASDN